MKLTDTYGGEEILYKACRDTANGHGRIYGELQRGIDSFTDKLPYRLPPQNEACTTTTGMAQIQSWSLSRSRPRVTDSGRRSINSLAACKVVQGPWRC
jgi:hypothetical protein